MAGRGAPRASNWGTILAGIALGFQVLVVVLGGFMAYAYLNGRNIERLDSLERRMSELERGGNHGGSR